MFRMHWLNWGCSRPQLFAMLTRGCGEAACKSPHCASNGDVEALSPNEAALRLMQLAQA